MKFPRKRWMVLFSFVALAGGLVFGTSRPFAAKTQSRKPVKRMPKDAARAASAATFDETAPAERGKPAEEPFPADPPGPPYRLTRLFPNNPATQSPAFALPAPGVLQ